MQRLGVRGGHCLQTPRSAQASSYTQCPSDEGLCHEKVQIRHLENRATPGGPGLRSTHSGAWAFPLSLHLRPCCLSICSHHTIQEQTHQGSRLHLLTWPGICLSCCGWNVTPGGQNAAPAHVWRPFVPLGAPAVGPPKVQGSRPLSCWPFKTNGRSQIPAGDAQLDHVPPTQGSSTTDLRAREEPGGRVLTCVCV